MTDVRVDSPDRATHRSFRGQWWLADAEQKRVGGELEFVPGVGGRLELDGDLIGEAHETLTGPLIIFGICDGRRVTIPAAQWSGNRGHSSWGPDRELLMTVDREIWTCGEMFIGIHEPQGLGRQFNGFQVQTSNLAPWVNKPEPAVKHKDGKVFIEMEMPDWNDNIAIDGLGQAAIFWAESWSTVQRLGKRFTISVLSTCGPHDR